MKTCRKYIQLFWMAALFFLVGGQFAHAYQSFSCERKHSVSHEASDQECPAEHQCGQTHSHTLGILEENTFLSAKVFEVERYLPYLDSPSEGVAEEIEYPPRLS